MGGNPGARFQGSIHIIITESAKEAFEQGAENTLRTRIEALQRQPLSSEVPQFYLIALVSKLRNNSGCIVNIQMNNQIPFR
ncbi:MAG: hypothetical protein A4E58_00503 [Syntrophorhabdus sp. PtaB.Bin006]|nr:MAG: hypothetical protein A4E58_00503 [Syntrophorhabdus sp. PtaB.Bin006]